MYTNKWVDKMLTSLSPTREKNGSWSTPAHMGQFPGRVAIIHQHRESSTSGLAQLVVQQKGSVPPGRWTSLDLDEKVAETWHPNET